MSKKEALLIKDSSVPVLHVGIPSITVNLLNDGAIERLKELVKAKFISFAKPIKESTAKNVHFTDFGIDSTNYRFNREEANAR